MHRLACAFAAGINEKIEKVHVLKGSCWLLKSNLAIWVLTTHDCMQGHSCLVEASNSIKLIQYAAWGTRTVKRRKYTYLNTLNLRLKAGEITVIQYADAASYLLELYCIIEQWSLGKPVHMHILVRVVYARIYKDCGFHCAEGWITNKFVAGADQLCTCKIYQAWES